MTNIASLPLLVATAGVQTDEDFIGSLALTRADGGTPLDLSGLTFTMKIGTFAMVAVSVFGGVLSWDVPTASKATWSTGRYRLSLLATDGVEIRDVFSAKSTITIGNDASFVVSTASGATAAALAAAGIEAQFYPVTLTLDYSTMGAAL
jgi:hypothetical protein